MLGSHSSIVINWPYDLKQVTRPLWLGLDIDSVVNCLSSLDLFISLLQTSFSLSIQWWILYCVLEAAARGKILYFNTWMNAEGSKSVFSNYPPRVRWEGSLERRYNGGSSRRPWRNNSTLPRGWDGPSYLAKGRDGTAGMDLLLFPKVISFWGPKNKIWKPCRSEDIQVHQCWEVFPKVLLLSI